MALTVKAGFEHDLEPIRRDLEAVELGLGKAVNETIRKRFAPVVAEVHGIMPFDPTHRGWKGHDQTWRAQPDPGHIRDSIKGQPVISGFNIVTTHPGGPVHWWGGTIRPRQAVIDIHHLAGAGEDFVSKEAERAGQQFDQDIDALLRRHNL